MIATFLNQALAEKFVQQYRQLGNRAGVLIDTKGLGSTAYRVVLGQFATERDALAARRQLPRDIRSAAILWSLFQ